MTTTITAGATVVTPRVVLGYLAESESGNTIHDVIGASDPAVTLGVESSRSGTLGLVFTSTALAWAARSFLKTGAVFTLASTDSTPMAMRFVRDGRMSIELDDETLSTYTLRVTYREVA